MNYDDFVQGKLSRVPPTGLATVPPLHSSLFPHQRDLVSWALRRGRAAIFASTGLGKTAMQLEWARHVMASVNGRVLILAPLAVAAQTVREGERIGAVVRHVRDDADVQPEPGIYITNYDRLHRFDPTAFQGVVLDESSCIKHSDSATLRVLLDAFAQTPFKLCATATPAPNDYTELGTHAEFLGICTKAEMLAEFFVHDGGSTQDWRLKGHARGPFWKWVASWGALLRAPSDLGYEDAGYALPPLVIEHHVIKADQATTFSTGKLFAEEACDLTERRNARRASIDARVAACAALVNADAEERYVIWCDLNAESEALAGAIPGAVEVRGSQTAEEKESALASFGEGRTRVLISKPSICGFGLNWQHVARIAFVGVTDSWEAYYQAVRRCWRFGQKRSVRVHIFASEVEGSVVANIQRKERAAETMANELSVETREVLRAEVRGLTRETNPYQAGQSVRVPSWLTSEAT